MENFSVSHPLGGTDILTNVVVHLVPGGRCAVRRERLASVGLRAPRT
jgi:hypothetical protein